MIQIRIRVIRKNLRKHRSMSTRRVTTDINTVLIHLVFCCMQFHEPNGIARIKRHRWEWCNPGMSVFHDCHNIPLLSKAGKHTDLGTQILSEPCRTLYIYKTRIFQIRIVSVPGCGYNDLQMQCCPIHCGIRDIGPCVCTCLISCSRQMDNPFHRFIK